MDFDPRLKRESKTSDLIDDEELCTNLDDVLEEDETLEDNDEMLEEDPWEKQVRMGKKQTQTKYNVW